MNQEQRLFFLAAVGASVAHLCILGLCVFSSSAPSVQSQTRRIVVKTKDQVMAVSPFQTVKKSPLPSKKPQKEKENVTTATKKKPLSSAHLQKAKNALATLRSQNKEVVLNDLKNISIRSDEANDLTESDYADLLLETLKQRLRLPEIGDVKIELTLNKAGRVVNVKVVSSESVLNRQYVEKNVREIQFPSMQGEKEKTFIVILESKI